MITIIDARMGRGKSSAAAQYMNEHKSDRRFLYITPYLKEVDRMCRLCDFGQPDSNDTRTKLAHLKTLMRDGQNVASTHAMFFLLDPECLSIAQRMHYTLIIDEAVDCIQKVPITKNDIELYTSTFFDVQKDGRMIWKAGEYESGHLELLYNYATKGQLFYSSGAYIYMVNPDLFKSFEHVFLMTYMFNGQYTRAYLDYYHLDYNVCGVVRREDGGYEFSDRPDQPEPVDYSKLINIINDNKLNHIGEKAYALSKHWYNSRGKTHESIKKIKNHLNTFFRRRCKGTSSKQWMWTCFKSDIYKIIGDRNRFTKSHVSINAKATNEYKDRTCVAYMVNRYPDPMIERFITQRGVGVKHDEFALSEMIQFIWRSAIRENKPINLYIPSRRMRELLVQWMDDVKKGTRA